MPLTTYDDWMKRTAITFSSRSKELKTLDLVLQAFLAKKASRDSLKVAFDDWKRSRGQGLQWRRDERNRKYAMDDLEMELTGVTYDPAAGPNEMLGMDNARQGVLYLFSQMQVSSNLGNVLLEGGLSAGLSAGGASEAAKSITNSLNIPGKVLTNAVETASHTAATSAAHSWLYSLGEKILAELKKKFSDIDVTLAALKDLINVLVKTLAQQAAPFVSAGLDLAKGLANTTDAVIQKFREWRDSFGVQLLPGHPTVIVDSIRKAMRMSIFMGLYETVRGAISMAAAIASAGGSALVDAITAAATALIKLIWRLYEMSGMRKFFAQAKQLWNENHPKMVMTPRKFLEWYRGPAMSFPPLAIMTLISGICGDKMRFLKVLTDDGAVMDANEFNRQAMYVDNLKRWGVDYLSKCAYEFNSGDPLIEKLLGNVRANMKLERHFLWDGLLKFLNA